MKTISKILSVVLCLAMVVGFFTFGAAADTADHVVINQVYGGGGNSGATYKNDFIELYNPTNDEVDLTQYSLQYTSASGNSWGDNIFTFPSGAVIAAGGFYLVQMAAGNGNGVDLPTPDATGSFAMSKNNIKVALVKGSTAISGKGDTNVVDFVGTGSANEYEGSAAVAALSNSTAAIRKTDGVDTNDNSEDFKVDTPNAHNSSSSGSGNTGSGSQGGSSTTTPVIADGTYVISADGKAMTALTKNYGYAPSAAITISSGKVSTLSTSPMIFTITNVDGGVTIKDADGKYYGVGMKNDTEWFPSFQAPNAVDGDNSVWTVVKNSDNTYTFTSKGNGSVMCLSTYNDGASFGVYPASDTANVKSANLTLTSATSVTVLPSEAVSIKTVTDEATLNKYYKVTGVVTYVNGKNVYVQDTTGALCLYFGTAPTDLAVGDVVTAMGSYTEFSGLKELKVGTDYSKVTDSTLKLDDLKKTVTIADLVASDNAKYMCTYVVINGATIAVEDDDTYLSDGTNKILWYKPAASTTPANGDTVTEFKGAVGWHNGAQLVNTAATDVTITSNSNDDDDNNDDNTGSDNTGSDNTGSDNTGSDNTGSTTTEYVKVTDGVLTSGKYVLVATNGYAPTTLNDKNWVLSAQPTVSGDKVTDAKGAVVTLTVSGNTVKITDANGKTIYSSGDGAKMGEADTAWNWAYADGVFTFGTEANDEGKIRYLSSNSGSDFKFRAYYPATEPDKWGNEYTHTFNVYKLVGSSSDNSGSGSTGSGSTGSGSTDSGNKEEDKKPAAPVIDNGVKAPEAGTAYKFGMYQENAKKYVYFTGKTANKDYYLATSEKYADAVDVYVETVTGGYRLYFMDGTTKTYIDVYVSDNGYVNARLTTEPTAVLTWNAEHKTFTTKVTKDGAEVEYYIGTYNTFETLSASDIKYIATSFPAHLYAEEPAPTADNSVISVAVAAAVLSVLGATALIMKKKEF